MAEEHRCEAPEGHRLCANNCGFFGSSATMNLCSKCYRDVCLKEQQQASIKSTVENSLSASPSSSSSAAVEAVAPLSLPAPVAEPEPVVAAAEEEAQARPSRCFACRKRVGLTGFRCKCGTTFCGVHRYPEKHACTFDFKKVGREEIARDNPIVKADKLHRI